MSQPPKKKATGNAPRPGQSSQRPRTSSGSGARPPAPRGTAYNTRGRAPQPPSPAVSPLMWVGIAVGVVVVAVLAYLLVSPPWKNTVASISPTVTPTVAASSTNNSAPPPPTTGGSTVDTSGQPQHITVQHILIGFKDAVGFRGDPPAKAATRTEAEAKALAYQVLDMAKSGQDYDQLVAKYTDDAAPGIYKLANNGVAPTGTDEYSRSGMVPAFGNVGFTLQVGEIGIADYDPATSPYGWHIIKRVN